MKKKLLLLFIVMFYFIPKSIFAKEYLAWKDIYQPKNNGYWEYSVFNYYKTGDVFNFSDMGNSTKTELYVDDVEKFAYSYYFDGDDDYYADNFGAYHDSNDDGGKDFYKEFARLDDNCYGTHDDCLNSFVVPHDMVLYKTVTYYSTITNINTYEFFFLNVNDNTEIYDIHDLDENRIYKTGTVVFSGCSNYDMLVLPSYAGKTAFWKMNVLSDALYSSCLYSEQELYNYVAPEFNLKCEDDSIEYGKKTKCFVSASVNEKLQFVSFDLNIPNFKISDISFPNYVETKNGDKQYNLAITDDNLSDEYNLMSFYLEGITDNNYTDDIKIINLKYKDAVYEGDYDNLVSNLNIKSNTLDNPKTSSKVLFILLPLILLGVAVMIKNFKDKDKKENLI